MPVGVYQRRPLSERFWEKVDRRGDDECWPWLASKRAGGYGQISAKEMGAHPIGAHRVSWLLNVGEVPDGLCVLHKCDNPPCVNPHHLFLGTHLDNAHDKIAKGRQADRERHSQARLTWDDVRSIRRRYEAGELQATLAADHGVSVAAIGSIVLAKVWQEPSASPIRHDKGPTPERSRTARLTWDEVRSIRARLAAGVLPMTIAREIGMAHTSICAIRDNKTWKETA